MLDADSFNGSTNIDTVITKAIFFIVRFVMMQIIYVCLPRQEIIACRIIQASGSAKTGKRMIMLWEGI